MNKAGTSIAEVLVVVTVLSVGLGALAGLTRSSARALAVARALDRTQSLIESVADSMVGYGIAGAGTRSLPEGQLTWNVPGVPASPGWVRFDHRALDGPIVLHFYTRAEW